MRKITVMERIGELMETYQYWSKKVEEAERALGKCSVDDPAFKEISSALSFSQDKVSSYVSALRLVASSHLPSGSGFDCGTSILVDKSTSARVVLVSSYHHMDSDGCYIGWSRFKVLVAPCFNYPYFTLKVSILDRCRSIPRYLRDLDISYWTEVFESALSELFVK